MKQKQQATCYQKLNIKTIFAAHILPTNKKSMPFFVLIKLNDISIVSD